MKVLLVHPPLDSTNSTLAALGIPEPLGLESLAAALPAHEVRILDLRLGGSLVDELERFGPRVVGTTAVTASLRRALEILGAAKSLDPMITAIIGGHHATLRPQDCQVRDVDVIVRGEGERTLAEVVSCLEGGKPLSGVTGIAFRTGYGWTANAARQLPRLDAYADPARHLTEASRPRYSRVGLGPILSALTSRGCSRRCSFCAIWRFHGGKYRQRSAERIVAELAARPETTIDFVDDDSFGNPGRMERLRQLVVERLPGRTFRFFVRADAVVKAPDLFERWAEAGMRHALLGLESFSDAELADLNKSATARDNVEALHILKQAGITALSYFIVNPNFDLDDFQRLGDTVERLAVSMPAFGTLTPFPGTVLFEEWKDRLKFNSWDEFDGLRAVVETRLPRAEYYRQLATLYRRAYRSSAAGPSSGNGVPWYEQMASAIESIEVA